MTPLFDSKQYSDAPAGSAKIFGNDDVIAGDAFNRLEDVTRVTLKTGHMNSIHRITLQ